MRSGQRLQPVRLILLLSGLAACSPVRSANMEFRRPAPEAVRADSAAGAAGGSVDAGVAAAASSITGTSIRLRLDALTGGRPGNADAPGAAGRVAAVGPAVRIVEQFRRLGLKPGGSAGGYLVRGASTHVALERDSVRLRFAWGDHRLALRYGADYVAVAGGGAVDARAMFLGGEARAADRLPALRGVIPFVRLSSAADARDWPGVARDLAAAAARNGVPALVLVPDARFDASRLPDIAAALEAPRQDAAPVAVFVVRHQAAERVLYAAGIDPDVLDADPSSPLPLKRLSVQAASPARFVGATDVVALLPGSDPARSGEYVVVTAGMSVTDDTIAGMAGAAALLEAAAALTHLQRPPARPVLFVAAAAGGDRPGGRRLPLLSTTTRHNAVTNVRLAEMGGGRDPLAVVDGGQGGLGEVFRQIAARYPDLRLTVEGSDCAAGASTRDATDGAGEADGTTEPDPGARVVPSVVITAAAAPGGQPSGETAALDADGLARAARLVFLAAERLASGAFSPAAAGTGPRSRARPSTRRPRRRSSCR